MKKIIIISVILCSMINSYAQVTVEGLLSQIAQNNTELKAYRQKIEARRFELMNSLLPDGLNLSYDQLNSTTLSGEYSEFIVSLPFEFPFLTLMKMKVVRKETEALEIEYQIRKRDILQKARLSIIELVYQNIMIDRWEQRLVFSEEQFGMNETMLKEGEIGLMEYNRSKIQFHQMKSVLTTGKTKKNDLLNKLKSLNGGLDPVDSIKDYSRLISPDKLIGLVKKADSIDLTLRSLDLNNDIAGKKANIMRWNNLPDFELGYRYDQQVSENFSGIHLGLNIPLWNNFYKVRQYRAETEIYSLQRFGQEVKLRNEIDALYGNYIELYDLYLEIGMALVEEDVIQMLEKALNAGQISKLDYYRELGSYFDFIDNILGLEKELQILSAKIQYYTL